MREVFGDLWDYIDRPDCTILITTNGTITKAGRCVMGRGCAKEAKDRFPGIDIELAQNVQIGGNVIHPLQGGVILSFPVKHRWYETANLALIANSARRLGEIANEKPDRVFVLPRPGCGNGRLLWQEVKAAIGFLPDNVWVITNGTLSAGDPPASHRGTDEGRQG